MLATTGPFETMIEGRAQVIAFSVAIDLPGGVYPDVSLAVKRFEIDASIDSDMPEGTRLEEGFSAVQGTFTLAGRVDASDVTKTAAWLFGRYSTTSPLYQSDALYAPVTITLGLYPEGSGGTPELLTKLVGLVEDYGLDSDGNVAFTVIDLRQSFRGSVDLPAVVTVPPFNAGMTNEFVVDALLRAATDGAVSSWPARRASCVLAVGFRSSLWPEVGTLAGINQPLPTFMPGPWGTGFGGAASTGGGINATYTPTSSLGTDFYVEFLLSGLVGAVSANVFVKAAGGVEGFTLNAASDGALVEWVAADGVSFVDYSMSGLSLDSGPHVVGFRLHMPVGASAFTTTIYVDGAFQTSGSVTTPAARTGVYTAVYPNLPDLVPIAGLQVTTETSPTPSYPFTPRAVLDPSLNPLDVVSAITGDPWQTIQQLAQSELAVAGFEGDTFFYRNRQTLRSSASVRDITSDQALNKIEESSSAAAIVNRAQVGWTPWTFADTATTLWTAPKAHKVPAHGSWSTTVTIDGLAAQVDTALSVLPLSSTDATHSYYRVSNDKAGTSTHAPITVTVAQSSGSKFTITATNTSGTDAWLVSSADYVDSILIPAGTPTLRIAGLLVTAGDEQTQDYQWPLVADGGAAGSRFGEIVYQQTGNVWNQDEDATNDLCIDVVTGSYVPRPDLVNVDIDPDPRLERCDRVHLVDTARTGVDEYALIFGYGITYEAGDPPTFSMTMDARTVTGPGGWILGVTGRSRLAVSTHLP